MNPVVRLVARIHFVSPQEWMQETATGSSRAEDCQRPADCTLRRGSLRAPDAHAVLEESAEESSVLSSEEASNAKDQDFRLTSRVLYSLSGALRRLRHAALQGRL